MNKKVRTIIFQISALLLLAGAALYIVQPIIAPYLFAFGAAGISLCYLTIPAKDLDFRERRLHRYNIFAGLLCIFSSGLMFNNQKEWVICLAISAFLQIYTAFITSKKK